MRTLSIAIFAFAMPALGAGCVHEYDVQPEQPAAPEEDRPDTRPVAVAYDGPVAPADRTTAPDAPAAAPQGNRADPIFFHLGAGYGALGEVDLDSCRDHGLARGYVRVRVTFRTDGRVAHAALQSDVLPPPEALACIGERLESALVPAFEGGDFTLSKTFFVD
jgi:hypothetical protein